MGLERLFLVLFIIRFGIRQQNIVIDYGWSPSAGTSTDRIKLEITKAVLFKAGKMVPDFHSLIFWLIIFCSIFVLFGFY